MIATVIPNLIAPDLVSVQALENKVGMINILQFATGSDKGSTPAGEVFASPLAYKGTDVTYTASAVDGEELVADGNGEFHLMYTPVRPHTLRVLKADGTVNTSADLADPYTGEVTGVQAGEVAYYIYDNESVPVKSPQLKMDIKSIPITAQSRKLSAVWSFDAAYELQKELKIA